MSEIICGITLFKYGGYHKSLDVIVQKNLGDSVEDFCVDGCGSKVSVRVSHLNYFGIAHGIIQQLLR